MRSEPQYFDCDDDGIIPEESKSMQIPKRRETQTQFQVDVLEIFWMRYFPRNDRDAKKELIEIERGMAPLSSIPNFNRAMQNDRTVYPFPKDGLIFRYSG